MSWAVTFSSLTNYNGPSSPLHSPANPFQIQFNRFFFVFFLSYLTLLSLSQFKRNKKKFSFLFKCLFPMTPPPPNKKPSHFNAIDMVSRHLFVHLPKLFTLFFRKKVFFFFHSSRWMLLVLFFPFDFSLVRKKNKKRQYICHSKSELFSDDILHSDLVYITRYLLSLQNHFKNSQ